MSSTFLPQIKNIVFLMLENRSLDNLLGWLYSGSQPSYVFPPGSSTSYDGLRPKTYFNPAYSWGSVKQYEVVPCPNNLGSDQDRVPAYDPYEPLRENAAWNGVMNQLYGNQDRIGALPSSATRARMLGFLQDYYAWYMASWQGLDILWTYQPSQMPVINGLAARYGVSDAWFCSVPSQTNPNRAYSLCGTSLGRESNLQLNAVETFDVPTILNEIGKKQTWGLYFTDVWKNKLSYTEYTFPQISQAPNGERGSIDDFLQRAKDGSLRAFSYIEPKWGYGKGTIFVQGTDYHPPSHLVPGERFLNQVYSALRNGPLWNQTLLVVTFDEHGGTYDHVAPSGAINPDGKNGENGFKFDLFGARVPTILISPYIRRGTVFRAPAGSQYPFDHTSFIHTFLKWADADMANVDFGKRMPASPTFEGVFSSSIVNEERFMPPQLASAVDAPEASELPVGAGHPLNAHFEGMPFYAVRAILQLSQSLVDVMNGIARYKADPAAFDRSLGLR